MPVIKPLKFSFLYEREGRYALEISFAKFLRQSAEEREMLYESAKLALVTSSVNLMTVAMRMLLLSGKSSCGNATFSSASRNVYSCPVGTKQRGPGPDWK